MGYLAMTQLTLTGRGADRNYDAHDPVRLSGLSGTYSPAALGVIGLGIFGALAAWMVLR